MKDRSASLFPLAMLMLLAALTFWLNRLIQDDKPGKPQRHDPDYWVERFEVRRFDIDGKLQHTLVAEKLLHYPDDDTTVVTAPNITYHQQSPATASARMAYLDREGREITLVDKVRVVRHDVAGDAPPTVLEAMTLKVFPDEETARTRDPVIITQGHSIIRGSGLDLDNKTGITVLHGRVTGTLHRNRTDKP